MQKIAMFSNVPPRRLFSMHDRESIYTIPEDMRSDGLDREILSLLGLHERVEARTPAGAPAQVLGLAVVYVPPSEDFCLLEYLAVDSAHRARAIGGRLFAHSAEQALGDRPGAPLLVEVDAEGPADPEQELRRRRQRFYLRHGCRRVLDCSYVLPLPGQGTPPPMDLWIYLAEPQPRLRRETLAGWLRAIYQHVYQCSPDDPRIAEMLQPVPDPVRLE